MLHLPKQPSSVALKKTIQRTTPIFSKTQQQPMPSLFAGRYPVSPPTPTQQKVFSTDGVKTPKVTIWAYIWFHSWSKTLKTINGTSDKYLASGFYSYQLANAAEILHAYPAWPASNFTILVHMLNTVFYPMNHQFLVEHNDAAIDHYWANWDLCNIATVDYFKNGTGNGAVDKMIWTEHIEEGSGKRLGQGQEAGRDQGHETLDFSLLGVIAQQSFNQGDDLFAYFDNRILAGSEYVSKYNLNYSVPYTTYNNSDVIQTVISNASR
ncbi:hypothetical protein ACMFMG_011922 [Clarireedia jacksonii]